MPRILQGVGAVSRRMLIGGALIHTPVMLKYASTNLFHLYKLRKRSNRREATTIICSKICRKVTVGPAAVPFPCMSSASFEFSGTLRFGRYANHAIPSPPGTLVKRDFLTPFFHHREENSLYRF